jgi:hypothetical protein
MEKIEVFDTDVPVRLRRGDNPEACTVSVRPLSRYEMLDVTRAASVERTEDARQIASAFLVRRMQIVGADKLTHFRTGKDVPFATEAVPGLSRHIASRAVFEALSDADFVAIDKALPPLGGGLSEAQSGN